jgi:hypothetical protein
MATPIDDFWRWWPGAQARIAERLGKQDFEPLAAEISERVHAIEKSLDWEIGPGKTAKLAFCISGKGDPILRRATERWLRAAPPASETWEFHAARPGGDEFEDLTLDIAGHSIVFADVVAAFEVDDSRERVDATFFHPAFPSMSEDLRVNATFLLLDGTFGEDGVERWLGEIDIVAEPPEGARPFGELKSAVEQLARTATRDKYAVLRGAIDGAPIMVTKNCALKRIDHLDLDMHVAIELPLLDPTPEGLTTNQEADVLNAMEDELMADLGDAAVYFGRETHAGRRTLHFFAPELGRAADVIARWAERQGRAVDVRWRNDPTWEALGRWG